MSAEDVLSLHASRGLRTRLSALPLALFAGLQLVALPGAPAQAAPGDECAAMPTPADEIACLRRALAATQAGGQTSAPAASPTRPAAAPAERRAVQQAAPPVPAAAPREEVSSLGSEQLPGNREKFERRNDAAVQAVVVAGDLDREGLLLLQLDNGQTWKQVERPSIQIAIRKSNSYPVEIKKSGFGGYRMYFPDMNRTIIVRRMQ